MQVILAGMSYEATAALFTLAHRHKAVKAAVLRYPFWDLYNDVACPGGVPMKLFVERWTEVTTGLDSNNLSALGRIMPLFFG